MKANAAHIVILCSRLDLPGGIERAVVNTANLFAQQGHTVTLLVLDETDESFYPLDEKVKLVQQPVSFGITREGNVFTRKIKLLTDVLKLRKLLKKLQPSLVIATEYPFAVAAVLSGARKRSTVVSWEHHHYHELKRSAFWEKLFRMAYPKLHAVVCLNSDEQELFRQVNNNPVVIPNFILPMEQTCTRTKQILTIARLTPVKGIEYLLNAAKEILPYHPGWTWKLIGDGELKEEVERFITEEGLTGLLLLQPPKDHQVMTEYQQSSLYVMTSVNECFPMTLLEAQAAGLPCIAFDCETGPRHIINKENGVLVEKGKTDQLCFAIRQLIDTIELRNTLSEGALANIQRFSPEAVYTLWEEKVLSL
ncbi:MAG: glycosyltransferase family 4 protein [Chitinophagaceae bacterium]|nr:glycosyltransferase family 4 protein [Chitinophagaceae bacterium]